MNWGPTVSFDNLTVTTTGLSADGINLGRDNSAGRVTVNKKATINVAQGMGAASSAAPGYGGGEHIITFNGSSEIRTQGDGSLQWRPRGVRGRGRGCGAGLFQCKSMGAAEVRLLGGANDVHQIATTGNQANAVTRGRGFIQAGNLDIETSGAGAHRTRGLPGLYYNGLADIGGQDYAGSVELTGNVSVRTSGAGAYAFYADSYSAASGQDSQGTVAAIRSYDSATGLPVTDKVYRVTGDMLATRSGVIDLRMGNASRYTGATTITDNGVLNLAIAGGDSVWRMTRDSSLSAVTLSSGATLALADAARAVNALTLRGTVLNQGGLIDLAGGRGTAGNRLTIIGDYAGQAGTVLLRTGGDDSLTDRLVIDGGAATGDTGLLILNTGGAGAQTQQGIRVVQAINGARTAADAFHLDAGSTGYRAGTGTLAAGGYDYSLVRGGSGGASSPTGI